MSANPDYRWIWVLPWSWACLRQIFGLDYDIDLLANRLKTDHVECDDPKHCSCPCHGGSYPSALM